MAKAGNIYNFDSIAAGASAELDFEVPVKRITNLSGAAITITGDSGTSECDIADKGSIEFPNIFGYPDTLFAVNNTNAPVTPKFVVECFGDLVNDDYFEEE